MRAAGKTILPDDAEGAEAERRSYPLGNPNYRCFDRRIWSWESGIWNFFQ